ncbi:hypothetical protein BKA69DRAFT_250451 [Paraphysoderma sedebokerense]|nr:hypothetical protein BKA69DRAFT_250451 [Paraphysoderma sedebokerense]
MNLSGNVIYAVFVCAVQLIYVYKIIIFVKNREMLTQTNNSNFNSSLESDKGNNQATRTTQSEMAAKTTLKSVANLFNSHKYIVAMLVAFTLINFIVSVLSLSVIPHSLGIAINSFLSSVFLHICIIFDGIVKTRISNASKMHQSPSKSTIQPGLVRI